MSVQWWQEVSVTNTQEHKIVSCGNRKTIAGKYESVSSTRHTVTPEKYDTGVTEANPVNYKTVGL